MQLRELLRKYWLVYWRTPSYTLARCFLTLVVAFIFGSMFFQAGVLPQPYASMGSIQNIIGIIFSSTNFLGMTNLMAVMPLAGECDNGRMIGTQRCASLGVGHNHRWLLQAWSAWSSTESGERCPTTPLRTVSSSPEGPTEQPEPWSKRCCLTACVFELVNAQALPSRWLRCPGCCCRCVCTRFVVACWNLRLSRLPKHAPLLGAQ
jgi:hypothetical protein